MTAKSLDPGNNTTVVNGCCCRYPSRYRRKKLLFTLPEKCQALVIDVLSGWFNRGAKIVVTETTIANEKQLLGDSPSRIALSLLKSPSGQPVRPIRTEFKP